MHIVRHNSSIKGLEKTISKKIGRAIADYDMLSDGDRILVAVSGGKDSLSLLKMLALRRSFVPIKYELVPVYVDFGYQCVDKNELEKFVSGLGLKLSIKKAKLEKKGGGRTASV
ncbi:MAG TPA: ATP-binding protein, partial [Candidatus Omnitrophota bacterium]|nr:ATP-binding protein [Candidatus Omnitrophota bacterium]